MLFKRKHIITVTLKLSIILSNCFIFEAHIKGRLKGLPLFNFSSSVYGAQVLHNKHREYKNQSAHRLKTALLRFFHCAPCFHFSYFILILPSRPLFLLYVKKSSDAVCCFRRNGQISDFFHQKLIIRTVDIFFHVKKMFHVFDTQHLKAMAFPSSNVNILF